MGTHDSAENVLRNQSEKAVPEVGIWVSVMFCLVSRSCCEALFLLVRYAFDYAFLVKFMLQIIVFFAEILTKQQQKYASIKVER